MSKLLQSYGLTYGLRGAGSVENDRKLLVRMGRLELPRPCERWNLNPVRLPIPPHPQREEISLSVTSRSGILIEACSRESSGTPGCCGLIAGT
jgi:hypothetical protein